MQKRNCIRLLTALLALLALACAAVPALAEGRLNLTVPAWLIAGNDLTVSVGACDGAVDYGVEVRNYSDEDALVWVDSLSNAGSVTVPASYFEADHVYRVICSARDADGEDIKWNAAYIGVLTSAPGSGVTFIANNDELTTGGITAFQAYAPGAERIALTFSASNWTDSEERWRDANVSGECLGCGYVYDEAGEYETYATAFYPDGTFAQSDAVTVTVTGEGALGDIGLELSTYATGGTANIKATFTEAANADAIRAAGTDVSYEVTARDDDWNVIFSEPYETARQVTIPKGNFEPGKVYTVRVEGYAYGYDVSWVERQFLVRPTPAVSLSMKIDGAKRSEYELPANREFDVSCNIPDGVTAMRLRSGYGNYEFLNEREEWEDWLENGRVETGSCTDSIGNHLVFIEAYTGELDDDFDPYGTEGWSASNVTTIMATGEYALPAPKVVIPQTVERGQLLAVQVLNPDATFAYGGNYDAGIETMDGELVSYSGDYHGWNEGDMIYMSTADCEPGLYHVWVNNRAEGCQIVSNEGYIVVTAQAETVSLVSSVTEALVEEHYTLSASAPGAKAIQIRWEMAETGESSAWDIEESPSVAYNEWMGSPGTFTYIATAWFDDGSGGEYTVESDGVTVEVTSNGCLDMPGLQAPASADPDQPFEVTITAVENAEWYTIWADYDGWYWETETGFDGETFTVEIPATGQSIGDSVMVHVTAHAPGWETSGETRAEVCAAGTPDPAFELSISSSDLLLNEELQISAHMEGASAIMVYWGEGRWDAFPGDTWYRDDCGIPDEGTYYVQARAMFGAPWDDFDDEDWEEWDNNGGWDTWDWFAQDWTAYSEALSYTVTSYGWCDPATFTIEPDPAVVARGELVTITVDDWDEARGAYVRAIVGWEVENDEREWNDDTWTRWDEVDHKIYLSTANILPGEYILDIGTDGQPGWGGAGSEVSLTVTDPNEGITITASKTDVVTYERFSISAVAPGADRMQLVRVEDDCIWDYDGEGFLWGNEWENSGEHNYYAVAWYGEEAVESDIVTISVTAEGQCDMPAITAPDTVAPGEDFTVTLSAVDHAETYHIWIDDTDIDQWQDVHLESGETVDFHVHGFEADTRLVVKATAIGYGWDESFDMHHEVTVTEEEPNQAFEFSIDRDEIYVGEQLHVYAHMEGASGIMVYWGDGCWDACPGDTFEDNCDGPDDGYYPVYAKAMFGAEWDDFTDEDWAEWDEFGRWDGFDWFEQDWTATSEILHYTIKSYGCCDDPTYHIDPDPAVVMRGEFVTVTIDTWDEEHGESMGGWVEYPNGEGGWNWVDGSWTDWDPVDHKIYIVTSNLEEGDYRVRFDTRGKTGWHSNLSRDCFDITVTAPANGVTLNINKTEVLANEFFSINVTAPGADRIELVRSDYFVVHADGDRLEWNGERLNSGTYDYYAVAWYDGEAVQTDTVTVTVTAEGQLEAPFIDAPDEVAPYEGFTISLYPVEHAGQYHMWIDDTDIDMWENLVLEPGERMDFDIDGFEPGTHLIVHASVTGLGWDDSVESRKDITVPCGDYDEDFEISVDPEPMLVNDVFHVYAYKEGASAIRVYRGRGEWSVEIGDTYDRDEVINDVPGDWAIYAEAMFETPWEGFTDEDWNSFDWSQQNWSAHSPIVIVHTDSTGVLTDPDCYTNMDTVRRGGIVSVNIVDPDEHAGYYRAHVHHDGENGGEWFDDMWFRWDEKTHSILIPTASLEPGDYLINVRGESADPGWELTYGVDLPINVTEPEGGIVFDISAYSVPCYDPFTMSAYAPGAERVCIMRESEGEDIWAEGMDAAYGTDFVLEHIEPYVFYAIAEYPDGATAESRHITVDAVRNGPLDEPWLFAPGAVYAGTQDIPVSFGSVDHAIEDGYSVYITDETTGDTLVTEQSIEPGEYTFTVNFTADHVYCVHVVATSDTHLDGDSYWNMLAISPDTANKLVLPAQLDTIDDEAFEGINATLVIIPDGATGIGSRAFAECPQLGIVVIPDSVEYIADDAFDGCPYITIDCPSGSYAEQWTWDCGLSTFVGER